MSAVSLPDLSLNAWQSTRDTVRAYAEILSGVRKSMAPREKHWWHIGLRVAAAGLTTGPIRAGDRVIELVLSLIDHHLYVATNRGERAAVALDGQPAATFCDQVLKTLAAFDVAPAIDRAPYAATAAQTYDETAVARYWQVLPLFAAVLRQLKGEHRGESGPVVFWPHHFDVAVLLFSGRRVPGVDPADEESADENMNFGFLPGDEGIPEPYFYATAYPTPAGLTEARLPEGAHWHTEGWTGAVLPYAGLRNQAQPLARVLEYLRAARDAGFGRMR